MAEGRESIRRFVWESSILRSMLHGIARLPSLEVPDALRNSSVLSQQQWQRDHPNVIGTVLSEQASSPEAILKSWLAAAEAAYGAAGSEKDLDLQADIFCLANVIGQPDAVQTDPLLAMATVARDPSGWGLREFESCFLAVRRGFARLVVRGSPRELPKELLDSRPDEHIY